MYTFDLNWTVYFAVVCPSIKRDFNKKTLKPCNMSERRKLFSLFHVCIHHQFKDNIFRLFVF